MENDSGASIRSSSGVIVTKERSVRIENPFSLKVGQVFTGFGIGCGIGIGVGRPLNLGAIPMLNQVMVATRGATDAFSGVGRHVNTSLRTLGVKNVEAGIGCGVGFGHGFGAGLALKPGAIHQLQSALMLGVATIMKKFGIASSLPAIQGFYPASLQGSLSTLNEQSNQNPSATIMNSTKRVSENASQNIPFGPSIVSSQETAASSSSPLKATYSSRTDKVISTLLQNPLLKDEEGDMSEMVMRHQKLIEKLMDENKKLHRILAEDLGVSPERLQGSQLSTSRSKPPCDECFECRRRQRRR